MTLDTLLAVVAATHDHPAMPSSPTLSSSASTSSSSSTPPHLYSPSIALSRSTPPPIAVTQIIRGPVVLPASPTTMRAPEASSPRLPLWHSIDRQLTPSPPPSPSPSPSPVVTVASFATTTTTTTSSSSSNSATGVVQGDTRPRPSLPPSFLNHFLNPTLSSNTFNAIDDSYMPPIAAQEPVPSTDEVQYFVTRESRRSCRSCGITRTLQWRKGPDGTPSLCNACGLHYYKIIKRERKLKAAYQQPRLRLAIAALLN